MDARAQANELLAQLATHAKYNRIEYFEPYEYQKEFYHLEGHETPGVLANQRALIAANQVGKTQGEAFEVAYMATGLYPDWWEGHVYDHPVEILVASNTNEMTRDRCQEELCGDPASDAAWGTGAIPRHLLGKATRKAGVPNALDNVLVKHTSGEWSQITFRAYEQGPKKFMGSRFHHVWADEEPPADVWSQMLRSTFSTGGDIAATFTPEEGMTEIVYSFHEDIRKGQAVMNATWDDAPHMTKERREQFLEQVPVHERKLRSAGEPLSGSGIIFPVADEDLMVEPFTIPSHYARIIGADFGYDHPFAAVAIAHDRDQDKYYVYDCFKESRLLIPVAADRLKSMGGTWIPVVWPHDGLVHDKQAGRPLADLFRDKGVAMHPDKFSNPPGPGQKEGQGGDGVEVGLQAIHAAMEEGRFKVFANLDEWFREKRMYHRKIIDGKVQIVKKKEDLMSATRYAFMMIRHAIPNLAPQKPQANKRGLRTWT